MSLRVHRPSLALVAALSLLAPTMDAAPAEACGACFHSPEGNPTAVNAHRMVFAMSPRGTTLWDQIVYEGDPGDFVWVLPIAGEAQVELADNGFFEELSALTVITMVAPAPPRTTCADPCADFGPVEFGNASASGVYDRGDGGVTVYHQGTVGPYETATIGSDDPQALHDWLVGNGYAIDDTMVPVLDAYVEAGMNFVALRLQAGEGVDRMQPVRVTVPGLATSLPLRMVQGGVGVDVNLELFVFAESRIETANFGNAEVDRVSVAYDWDAATFDYDARFEDALFAGTGDTTNWVTEYAMPFTEWTSFEVYSSVGPYGDVNSAAEDIAVVHAALPGDAYLTRLRTRLQRSELDADLVLQMSTGDDVPNRFLVTEERNRAPEPVCADVCAAPNGIDPGGSTLRGTGTSFRCSASPSGGGSGLVALAVSAALLALVRRRAKRVEAA